MDDPFLEQEAKRNEQNLKAMNWALDQIFQQGFGIKLSSEKSEKTKEKK